ncbi:hypothetical protein EYF80_030612 [Liparis tanakae]|uniref:Secreted protein n=1 Tax=Liparis tanakae TaxID=230148 RepID=A0A4Z2H2R8_9TELE|nr:hypothetical protein EYF80_030612 [Liparis tanakae]
MNSLMSMLPSLLKSMLWARSAMASSLISVFRWELRSFQFPVELVEPGQPAPPLQLLFHRPAGSTAPGRVVERAPREFVPVCGRLPAVSQGAHPAPPPRRSTGLAVPAAHRLGLTAVGRMKASLTLCRSILAITSRSVVSEIPPCTIRTLFSITVARGSQLKIFWMSLRIVLPCTCRQRDEHTVLIPLTYGCLDRHGILGETFMFPTG